MTSLATRRLIDAAATLDAPERALVNLWVNRGLDDAEVARMTGMSESVIAERRTRIVERLSDELGLPAGDVRSALNELVPAPQDAWTELEATDDNGSAGTAEVAPDSEPPPDPTLRSSSWRRSLLWAALALVVLAVLIVVRHVRRIEPTPASSGHLHRARRDRAGPRAEPAEREHTRTSAGAPRRPCWGHRHCLSHPEREHRKAQPER